MTLVLGTILAVGIVLISLRVRLETLVRLCVVATFLSRFSVHVGPLHVRAEQVAPILLAIRLAAVRKPVQHGWRRRHRSVGLAVALVAVNLVASLLYSPQKQLSLNIVAWLAIDAVFLWALSHVPWPVLRRAIFGTGFACAALFTAGAIVAWLSATIGGPVFGVQVDSSYGGYAAYATSFEANIAGQIIGLWGVAAVALLPSARRDYRKRLMVTAILAPFGLIATDTRAVLFGYVAAIACLTIYRRIPLRKIVVAGIVLSTMGLVAAPILVTSSRLTALESKLLNLSTHGADVSVRTDSAALALQDIRGTHYLTGLGADSYGQRHLDPTRPGGDFPGYLGILPLQLLYDGGIGAVIVVWLLFASALPRNRRGRSLGIALGVLYFLAALATSPLWLGFTWLFLGCGLSHKIWTERYRAPGGRVDLRLVTPASGFRG